MTDLTKRVFVVDDSPIVRHRLVRIISEIPSTCVVGEAENAASALENIQETRPDLVILDISMPGGSGMHVLEKLKCRQTGPQIIMLSNFAHTPYREKCRQLGADHFFDKSTEFEKVMDIIARFQPAHP